MEKREWDPRPWPLERRPESNAVWYVNIILHIVRPLSIAWSLKHVNCLTEVHIQIKEMWMLYSSYQMFKIVSEMFIV